MLTLSALLLLQPDAYLCEQHTPASEPTTPTWDDAELGDYTPAVHLPAVPKKPHTVKLVLVGDSGCVSLDGFISPPKAWPPSCRI